MGEHSFLRFPRGACLLIGAAAALGLGPASAMAGGAAPKAPAIVELRVQPAALALENARDVRRVLVSGRTKEGQWIDLSRAARLIPRSEERRVGKECDARRWPGVE